MRLRNDNEVSITKRIFSIHIVIVVIVIPFIVYLPIIIGILLQDESHFLTRFLN